MRKPKEKKAKQEKKQKQREEQKKAWKRCKEELQKRYLKINRENIKFLQEICSRSGISWHELYYINANRYFTVLQLYDLDEVSVMGFMNDIAGKEDQIVTLDASHLDYTDFGERFDKVLKRLKNDKDDTRKQYRMRALGRQESGVLEFDRFVNRVKCGINEITIRIYVFAKTKEALQEQLDRLINQLSRKGIDGAFIQTNNLRNDYMALTSLSNPIEKMVTSHTVAHFMIQSEINRIDAGMGLIGYTVNGVYAPDIFDFHNASYDTIDIGSKGSGKSALRKLFEEMLLCYGNHVVYLFDIHDEYQAYARQLGIASVAVNEKNSVNLMQIFHVANDEGDDIIRENDIQTQISLVCGRFASFTGFQEISVNNTLMLHLDQYYRPYFGKHLSDLSNEDWLLLEEVLAGIVERYNDPKTPSEERQDLYKVKQGLEMMIRNYGYLFNRKTNIHFDLTRSLRFDVSFLKENDNKNLKSAYISLLLNYVSYGVFLNKERNEAYAQEHGMQMFDLKRPPFTLRVLVDETMEFADDSFLEYVLRLSKFARKAYAGLGFVIHGIEDLKRVGGSGQQMLSEVFELCANKYIGKLEGTTLQELKRYIPQLTDRDLTIVNHFEKGVNGERRFLAIDDQKRKIVFISEITRRQREYFKGGV